MSRRTPQLAVALALAVAGSCVPDSGSETENRPCEPITFRCASGYVCAQGVCVHASDASVATDSGGPADAAAEPLDAGAPADAEMAGDDAAQPEDAAQALDAAATVDAGFPPDATVPPDAAHVGLDAAQGPIDAATMDLELPLELHDLGLASSATGSIAAWRAQVDLDPADYDGNAIFFFEFVYAFISPDAGSPFPAVALRQSPGGNDVASMTLVPTTATSGSQRTGRVAFVPGTGRNTYRPVLSRTSSAGEVLVSSSRIIVRQTGATRTRIQIPLAAGSAPTAADNTDWPTDRYLDRVQGASYDHGGADGGCDQCYAIWQKRQWADNATWTFEAILASGSTSETAYATLYNRTRGGPVAGAEVSTSGLAWWQASTPVTFGAADHVDDQFEVRIKASSASATAYLAGARLYATLTKAAPAEVYLRVSGHRRTTGGAFFSGYYRHQLDTAAFSNPILRHEETGYCADGAPDGGVGGGVDGGVASRLGDAYLNDSTSSYAQAPNGITYGSTVKKLVRIDPGFPAGWQSGDRVLMMHPATNSQYESAESFAVVLFAP